MDKEIPAQKITNVKAQPTPSFLSEELRVKWHKLSEFGASVTNLTSFAEYLNGNTAMSDPQMDAGCRVMNYFPTSRSKDYWKLGDQLMETLHERFKTADEKEQVKLFWVARSLFLAQNRDKYTSEFLDITKGAGANHLPELDDTLDSAILKTLGTQSPMDCHIMAAMHRACHYDMIDLRHHLLGKSSAAKAPSETQDAVHKRNLATPASLHTDGPEGKSMELFIPCPSGDTLDVLLKKENEKIEKARIGRIAILTPKDLRLSKGEALVLSELQQEARGNDRLTDQQIADKHGLTLGTTRKFIATVRERIRALHHVQVQASESVLDMALRAPAIFAEPESNLLTQKQRDVLVTGLKLQANGQEVTTASISQALFGEADRAHCQRVSSVTKEIIKKMEAYARGVTANSVTRFTQRIKNPSDSLSR